MGCHFVTSFLLMTKAILRCYTSQIDMPCVTDKINFCLEGGGGGEGSLPMFGIIKQIRHPSMVHPLLSYCTAQVISVS